MLFVSACFGCKCSTDLLCSLDINSTCGFGGAKRFRTISMCANFNTIASNFQHISRADNPSGKIELVCVLIIPAMITYVAVTKANVAVSHIFSDSTGNLHLLRYQVGHSHT